MKKHTAIMLALLLLAVALVSCTDEEGVVSTEPETYTYETTPSTEPKPHTYETTPTTEPEPHTYETTPTTEPSIIELGTIQVSILLPDSWEVVRRAGTPLPGIEHTYDFRIIPPDGISLGTVTIGNTMRGSGLTAEELYIWHSTFAGGLLPRSVEDRIDYTRLSLINGAGIFSVLTDAALVGTIPPPNEYLYLGMLLASWDNGFIAHTTLLTNDTESFCFMLMQLAISFMEISFNLSDDVLTLEKWDEIRAAPVYDIAGLNLVNSDLTNREFLTEHILESTRGGIFRRERFSVPVVIGGEPHGSYRDGPDRVTWNAGGIGMVYNLLPSTDIHAILDTEVRRDIQRMQRNGFVISSDFAVRASADTKTAAFGLNMKLQGQLDAVYIYLLQDIPDSDYTLLLLFILFPYHWDAGDPAILAELSEHIGIDLMAYWPCLL